MLMILKIMVTLRNNLRHTINNKFMKQFQKNRVNMDIKTLKFKI